MLYQLFVVLCKTFGTDLNEENAPSSPLRDVYVSDTDSIFDKPRKINLKKKLKIEKSKREKYRREIIKLKKQNKYLKSKNTSQQELVKS
ncbi:unnamed protein product [Euphydryas editha]|uniref:BZIP domain-containing protein n=1 Tax=Euphydryas editha TaxID=104508 RepID=A0AAU9UC71_EUPED|nr:unnamed protein product [Euphydryas editha]